MPYIYGIMLTLSNWQFLYDQGCLEDPDEQWCYDDVIACWQWGADEQASFNPTGPGAPY